MSNIRRLSLARPQRAHGRIVCPAGVIACKKLQKISLTSHTRKKNWDSIFSKNVLEKKFLKDVKIYQKKTS